MSSMYPFFYYVESFFRSLMEEVYWLKMMLSNLGVISFDHFSVQDANLIYFQIPISCPTNSMYTGKRWMYG